MTEAEWLACENSKGMVEFVDEQASDRKKRLFAVACCRRIWSMMTDRQSPMAVEVAERHADGLANRSEWEAAREAASAEMERHHQATLKWLENLYGEGPYDTSDDPILRAALICVTDNESRLASEIDAAHRLATRRPGSRFKGKTTWAPNTEHIPEEGMDTCDLLHDIFGIQFRPVTFSPDWRTSTAISLAAQMYESRDFSAMPILADALQDAGCDSAVVLDHCRGPGPHVRGCWVVDLVLGKE